MKDLKNNQLISVIVPVYNAMPYLEDCITSILQQDYVNIEIIFVDDGSTDHSLDFLKEQQKVDSRIRIVHQDNAGASAARNRGLEEARGEWIAFIDADDIITKDYLSYLYFLAVKHDCYIASCGYETQMSSGKIIPGDQLLDGIIEVKKQENQSCPIPYTVWHLLISNKLIRENNIRFDESITYLEDVLFIYEVLFKIGKYVCGSKIGYRRIDHTDSLTNVRYKKENFYKWISSLTARYKICQITKDYPALFANAIYELAFFCNELKILYKKNLKNEEEIHRLVESYLSYVKKEVFKVSGKQFKKKCLTILCLYFTKIFFILKGTTKGVAD